MEQLAVQLSPDTPNSRPELYQRQPKRRKHSTVNLAGHSLERQNAAGTLTFTLLDIPDQTRANCAHCQNQAVKYKKKLKTKAMETRTLCRACNVPLHSK